MKFDIGLLGGGQLARMSIQAAQRMGLRCISLDPGEDTPASQIAPAIVGKLDDPAAIAKILACADRVTLENEFIPAKAILDALERHPAELIPSVNSLAIVQDKLRQRQELLAAQVPSPNAIALDDVDAAIAEIGFPMVLKARFGGYDGKGTRYANNADELMGYSSLWENGGWLAESFVPFKRELAAMVFISREGTGCFPTMETVQTRHVCDLVFPSGIDASEIAIAAVRAVGGDGLFGVEMFELEDGQILVNELAPRPHNTGHYTLDWGGVSQFEQHIRCVMGFPLGRAEGLPVCMANLLGQEGGNDYRRGTRAALGGDADVHVHWYGKAESRPGRKMGHLNVVGKPGSDSSELVQKAVAARERFYNAL
jgi:5-(carboxyamino)imidazole ribonucleotide synthase